MTRDRLATALTRRQLVAGGSLLAIGAFTAGRARSQAVPATPSPGAATMQALVGRIRAPELGDDVVTATVEALAACGIPTYEDTSATAPLIPVTGAMAPNRLLRWQAHNLAMEIRTRGGRDGAAYDAAIPVPEGTPPASLILMGYVVSAQTPGGDLARAIMGEQDWTQAATIRFPAVIGTLLVADVARDTSPAALRTLAVPLGARQGGVCSSLQAWVDGTIAAIFDALRVDEPDDTVGGVIAGIWNTIVDIGETLVGGVLSELTATVLAAVRAVVGLLGTASQIISLLQPWSVSVEPAPEATAFAIGDATVAGEVRVRVTSGLVTEWPPDVADCASVAGLALPSLTPGDAPLTWQLSESPIDLVAITAEPPKLDNAGTAVLAYETNHEPPDVAKGDPHTGLFAIGATVEREDLRTLGDTVLGTVLSGLPGIVRDIVVPVLGPMANDIVASLAGMVTVTGFGLVTVIYHTPPDVTPTTEVAEEGSCLEGTWRIVDFISMLNSFMATTGATVRYTDQSGDAFFIFGPGDAFEWSAAAFSVTGGDNLAGIGAVEATVTLDGGLKGRYEVDGQFISLVDFVAGGMSGVASAYLNGSLLGETPLDPAELVYSPGAGYTFACDGDQLLLYPNWIPASSPMVLQRAS